MGRVKNYNSINKKSELKTQPSKNTKAKDEPTVAYNKPGREPSLESANAQV